MARVVPADPAAVGSALPVAGRLHRAGIRTDVDDRGHDLSSAIAAADSLLVPYLVLVDAGPAGAEQFVRVRNFGSETFRDRDVAELIAEIAVAAEPAADDVPRLSRQPFAEPRVS